MAFRVYGSFKGSSKGVQKHSVGFRSFGVPSRAPLRVPLRGLYGCFLGFRVFWGSFKVGFLSRVHYNMYKYWTSGEKSIDFCFIMVP